MGLKNRPGAPTALSGKMSAAQKDEASAINKEEAPVSYGAWPDVEIWQSSKDLSVSPRPVT